MDTIVLGIVAFVVLLAVGLAVLGAVRGDGYGHRPGPRSRHAWDDDLPPFIRTL